MEIKVLIAVSDTMYRDDPLWMGWGYQSCKVNADPPFMG